jgi:hypothetical protein
MNPIAPREVAIRDNDIDDIHNPGDEAKENIKDDRHDVSSRSIFDDTVDEHKDIGEDRNNDLDDTRQGINRLNVTHIFLSFRVLILQHVPPTFIKFSLPPKRKPVVTEKYRFDFAFSWSEKQTFPSRKGPKSRETSR